MRVDLIGGEDLLAKVDALTKQQQDAQRARNEAVEALAQTKRDDLDNAAVALRAGVAAPKPKEPQAAKQLADADRRLAVVTLAVKGEREAWTGDLAARDTEIRTKLAEAEDATDEALTALIAEAEAILAERDEIRAHVVWLDNTSRNIGNRRVGADPLVALRAAVGKQSVTNSLQGKRDHEARVAAWNALVQRATATVPDGQRLPVLDGTSDSGKSYPAIDKAIEREIERMEEAGEEVPVPVTKKWMQRLGTTAKPKGKGTGWSPMPVEKTDMPPDTDSAEARRKDLVKS